VADAQAGVCGSAALSVCLSVFAGVVFGTLPGLAVVSVSSTTAAAIAFLIARFVAREKVCR
jgi:uncharacterized membrane protein YdjX (TVP38/TMEM64 family)